ncbi:O-methyltransferase [Neisseriaceae bacterium CLB008]
MSRTTWALEPELADYLLAIGQPEADVLARLRQQTAAHRMAKMSLAPEQAHLLTWLVQLTQAKHYLELGVFTGYSSTAVALALPADGTVTACDINDTFTQQARTAWAEAGVSDKITLHLQPALFTLDELLEEGRHNHYDLAFIDADKPSTPAYFERCLQLVRPGGIIAIDNVLLNGRVLAPANPKDPPSIGIMQAFNASLPLDQRIVPITVPVGDGLTLLLKK